MNKVTTVSLRNQRISPKKARLVIDSVRGVGADKALVILDLQSKKGSRLVWQLLKNAIDAAKAKDFRSENLIVSEAICQEGRKLKRNMVKARGRSTQFRKRMSHIKISLSKVESEVVADKSKVIPRSKTGKSTKKTVRKDEE